MDRDLNCKIKRSYKKEEPKPVVAPCEKPGLCDPEPGSFVEHCRLCGKFE